MTKMLSPLAHPFSPMGNSRLSYNNGQFDIYNDGTPSMLAIEEHEVLCGISDEAIAEFFPPTDEELAEILAVESFNEVMARLSMLEDCEENARKHFGHVGKRWEKRREKGLKGRPKPAEAYLPPKDHFTVKYQTAHELVPIDHRNFAYNMDSDIRAKQKKDLMPKKDKASHKNRPTRPILQPRKHCC